MSSTKTKLIEWSFIAAVLLILWLFVFGLAFFGLVIVKFFLESFGLPWTAFGISFIFSLRFFIATILPKFK